MSQAIEEKLTSSEITEANQVIRRWYLFGAILDKTFEHEANLLIRAGVISEEDVNVLRNSIRAEHEEFRKRWDETCRGEINET